MGVDCSIMINKAVSSVLRKNGCGSGNKRAEKAELT